MLMDSSPCSPTLYAHVAAWFWAVCTCVRKQRGCKGGMRAVGDLRVGGCPAEYPDHTRISEKLLKPGASGHRGQERPRSIAIQLPSLGELQETKSFFLPSIRQRISHCSSSSPDHKPRQHFRPPFPIWAVICSWLGRERRGMDVGAGANGGILPRGGQIAAVEAPAVSPHLIWRPAPKIDLNWRVWGCGVQR